MFDFRYHALSIAAVFLALGIGIVLGVTLGDSLVSEADQNIRESLRGDLLDARRDLREARRGLQRRDELIDAVLPAIASGKLRRDRVALVAFGDLPEDVEAGVRTAVADGGGRLGSVSVFAEGLPLEELQDALGDRFPELATDADAARTAGRRLGRSIVAGGRLARVLARELPERFRGDLGAVDAVAFHHAPPEGRPGDEEGEARGELERGAVAGMLATGVPVVGVEESGTEPSQISFYKDRGISSVDSIDTVGGRLALVLALAGSEGSFGFKDSARARLPQLDDERASR